MEDTLAYINNRKAVVTRERLYWLQLMDQLLDFKHCVGIKDILKICSDMSLYYKQELTKLK